MADRPTYSGVLNGVPFNELLNSPTFSLGDGSAKGQRVFHVPWGNRFLFTTAMLGSVAWVDGKLVRAADAQRFPGFDILEAANVDISGEGPANFANNQATFNHARIVVNYAPEEFEENKKEEEKVLATETLDFRAEALLMPEAGFKWGQYFYDFTPALKTASGVFTAPKWDRSDGTFDDAGKVILQQIPKLMPTINHMYTKLDLQKLPKAILSSVIGRVNKDDFPNTNPPTEGRTPAGQLLFTGATARRTITTKGVQPYELTIVLTERESPWNALWNAKATKWAVVEPNIYEPADFSPLTQFANMANLVVNNEAP